MSIPLFCHPLCDIILCMSISLWSISLSLYSSLLWVIASFCSPLSGSLEAMRFLTAVAEEEAVGDAKVEKVSRELWRRIWSNGQDINQLTALAEVFTHRYSTLYPSYWSTRLSNVCLFVVCTVHVCMLTSNVDDCCFLTLGGSKGWTIWQQGRGVVGVVPE